MAILDQVKLSVLAGNPAAQRVAGGSVGALAIGFLGSLIGGKTGAQVGAVGGGTIGAFVPEILKFIRGSDGKGLPKILDDAIGIVPAVEESQRSSQQATSATVRIARVREAIESGSGLSLLQTEQERLETAKVEPVGERVPAQLAKGALGPVGLLLGDEQIEAGLRGGAKQAVKGLATSALGPVGFIINLF